MNHQKCCPVRLPMSFRWVFLILLIGAGITALEIGVRSPLLAQEPEPPVDNTIQSTGNTVTVWGKVVNGTAGASVAPGSPITFHSFDQIVSPVLTIESTTGEAGSFEFRSVKLREGGSYAVVMEYGGIRYSSLLSREDLDNPIELPVYETTADISVIQINSQAIIIADINEKEREISALQVLSAQQGTVPDTGEAGSFEFRSVKLREGGSYAVVMEYGGIRYSSLLSREDLDNPIELPVYETTADISVIQINSQAIIIADINEKEREISALQVLSISNTGDRTLLPDLSNITSPTQINFLRFSLPPQATQLDVQSDLLGGDIIPIGTGFAVTSPIKPGDHSINLTFRFPYEGNSVSYRDSMLQGSAAYRILIPKELPQLQVTPLKRLPDIDIGDSAYRVWEGKSFAPGAALEVELSRR